jgi:hydroxymethylpyrimidine pyrophosphatase-like HAD family hydrolase
LTSLTQEILVASGATVVQVRDLKQVRQTPPLKGLVVHPANEIEAVIKDLKAALGDSLSVVRSSKVLIELFSPTVSKGQALATLAQYLEIPQQEVMAIGDQDNDIEMIAWAGLGVAMGNASAGAKAVAQVVAPPITEEGAAWAIEEYIFDQVTW